MKIRRLYLISIAVDKKVESTPANTSDSLAMYGLADGDPMLCRFFPDGHPAGATKLPLLPLSLSGFWSDKVRRAIVRRTETDDSTVCITVFDLVPDTMDSLLRLSPIDRTKTRVELIKAAHGIEEPGQYLDRIPSILYIEPSNPIAPGSPDPAVEAAAIVSFLKEVTGVTLPHALLDAIFFHDIGITPPTWETLAVRRAPLPPQYADVAMFAISDTVFDLALYISHTMQLRVLADRLKELPLYAIDLAAYLSRFRAGSKLFRKYREEFLVAMESQLTERMRIARLHEQLVAQAKNSFMSRYDDPAVSTPIRFNDFTYYDYDVLESALREFNKADQLLTKAIGQLRERECMLSDYLRDIVQADSTRINVSLQRSMYFLAVVGLLLAFVTVVIGVLPAQELRKWLSQLW
jgi:hypothetical protein